MYSIGRSAKWPPFWSSRMEQKTLGESKAGRHSQSMVPSVPTRAAVCKSPMIPCSSIGRYPTSRPLLVSLRFPALERVSYRLTGAAGCPRSATNARCTGPDGPFLRKSSRVYGKLSAFRQANRRRYTVEEMLGGARITYLGHATFRFATAGGEQIIIDPFLTDNPQTPDELKQVGDLDTILITHGHFDHFADVEPLVGQTGAMTVSNFEIFAYLQTQGVENAMPIQKGGTIQVGGIKITATHAFHSSSIQLDDGSYIYAGEPMGYVIEFESGFKLYHAGDTAVFGDMRLIGEIYNPDLAL